jgi:hypothetical protein
VAGIAASDLTYVLIVTGFVAEFHRFVRRAESFDRKVLPVEDFLSQYSDGNVEIMREIVDRAGTVLFDD